MPVQDYYVINGTAVVGGGGTPPTYTTLVPGSDANDGLTELTPKKTIAALLAAYGNLSGGGNVNVAGVQLGGVNYNGTAATFRQWTGQTTVWFRGFRSPIDDDSKTWTLQADLKTWVCNIGAGKTIPSTGGVRAKWLTRTDGSSRHYGYYPSGAIVAAALSADQTFNYNSGTGDLAWRDDSIPAGPASLTGEDAVMYRDMTASVAITATSSLTARFINLNFSGWIGDGTGAGANVCYGLQCGGASHLMQGCNFYDVEVHCITVSNDPNDSTLIQNCQFWGAGNYDGHFHIGMHAPTADVTNAMGSGNRHEMYTLLGPTGTPFDATKACNGVIAHTGSGLIRQFYVDGSTFRGYGQPGTCVSNANTAATGSLTNATTNAMQMRDCIGYNLRKQDFGSSASDCNLGMIRCTLQLTGSTGFTESPNGLFNVGATARTCYVTMDSCLIIANTDYTLGAGGLQSVFRIAYAGSGIVLVNTGVISVGSTADDFHVILSVLSEAAFVAGSAGFDFRAYDSYFFFPNVPAIAYFAFVNAPDANYTMDGNWYFGVGATRYSLAAGRTTSANWTSFIETAGHAIYDVNPQLADPTSTTPGVGGAGYPAHVSALKSQRQTITIHMTGRSLNGLTYARMRGPIQVQTTRTRQPIILQELGLVGPGRRRRRRLAR